MVPKVIHVEESWTIIISSTTGKKEKHRKIKVTQEVLSEIGELRGLRCECIHDDYILVAGQYTRHGYKPDTKTKRNRNIPINPAIKQELDELAAVNGKGFVFSEDGGETPIRSETIERQLNKALERIGIGDEERKRRNLTVHAWRHFFNTVLLMANITTSKVQSVTGHRTLNMTER